ncbi:stage V sporulation protein AE [Halalkalibacterium halodurans]|jgi:stage V sporulation protein AE|uniref:Stage V sporulation protein AE n=2 Tax=Halalkalibacterium halodurans TaxID=86665 RepID=Q9KCM7_HALH5|nr:stage V sporulation protein AE [Halalkalibacterium halodurans]MDY7222063.1 stage V sporulation protein AE [Halalkalibacterium halodurans]MDY7241339.1 stage V sporulation protein AE [Halalkalibacterium halodurans]MED3648514.1 stage V sporulation protein AE [Halalkalibacterium halodurans]MED4083072.1 stage V sporulation protein AE [Halalkalibacterium halodurans]MED4087099.1 stage V sporulation protein AE [Halalkalibacterium halodurans]
MSRRKVILITDGDESALKAIEHVARELGGRCISQSWGNPSHLTGEEIVKLILKTPYDPVLVMFDDCGFRLEGPGEAAMRHVANDPAIDVLGVIAVASSSHYHEWTKVDVSIDRFGELTEYGVDKYGVADLEIGRMNGDTVYILDELDLPIVVGIGDIGKMGGADAVEIGAPITRRAVEYILERSGYHE